jgi:gas vesicle protein GvpK
VSKSARKTTRKAPRGRRKTSQAPRTKTVRKKTRVGVASADVAQADALRAEIERLSKSSGPPRWNANPDDVQRSVVKLVLTLVEFLRQLMERQAIRRVEAGTISAEETEAIGLALMRLEETVRDLGAQFDLKPEDLNLDLGVGKLI